MENILNDQIFSNQLLELSTLKVVSINKTQYSDKIILGHGPFVKDENENILFDLRNYNFKFPFGHTHPLSLRNQPLLEKYLEEFQTESKEDCKFFEGTSLLAHLSEDSILTFNLFNKLYKLSYKDFCKGPLEIFVKYFNAIFINGTRLEDIQKSLRNQLSERILIKGNTLIISGHNLTKDILYCSGLYSNNDNFINDDLFLYVPITMKDDQLKDLTNRINLLIKEN